MGSDISLPGLRKIDGVKDSVVKYTIGNSENSGKLETGNLAELVDRASKNGNKITAGEIMEALQKQEISPEELDEIIVEKFSKNGVEVSSDSD